MSSLFLLSKPSTQKRFAMNHAYPIPNHERGKAWLWLSVWAEREAQKRERELQMMNLERKSMRIQL